MLADVVAKFRHSIDEEVIEPRVRVLVVIPAWCEALRDLFAQILHADFDFGDGQKPALRFVPRKVLRQVYTAPLQKVHALQVACDLAVLQTAEYNGPSGLLPVMHSCRQSSEKDRRNVTKVFEVDLDRGVSASSLRHHCHQIAGA